MPALTIHAELSGMRELAARLDALSPQRELQDTIDQVGGDAQRILALVAPKASGALSRGIQFRSTGSLSGEVVSGVRNLQGANYTRWVRFGHGEIVPRPDRQIASVIATRNLRAPHSGRRPALRFVIGGRVVYAARVKAWHPPGGDFVDRARPQITAAVDRRVGELRERLIRQAIG